MCWIYWGFRDKLIYWCSNLNWVICELSRLLRLNTCLQSCCLLCHMMYWCWFCNIVYWCRWLCNWIYWITDIWLNSLCFALPGINQWDKLIIWIIRFYRVHLLIMFFSVGFWNWQILENINWYWKSTHFWNWDWWWHAGMHFGSTCSNILYWNNKSTASFEHLINQLQFIFQYWHPPFQLLLLHWFGIKLFTTSLNMVYRVCRMCT